MIGAIQPNGVLVSADSATLIIEFASSNTEEFFGQPVGRVLGQPLSLLLGEAGCAELLTRQLTPTSPDVLRPWFVTIPRLGASPLELECFPHEYEGQLILEFVHREEGPAAIWEEDLVRQRIISDLIKRETLTGLAQVSAQIIRDVTGFDRVMIYRFAEDKHGEVIAESTVRHDSFLGLHYPASDIPDPARRHFVLNIIRSIPDIEAVPVPIFTWSGGIADASSAHPLDLTFSKLRAVAPVHIEYLSNMGVGGSMSISLTANNELWGLVACHHYGPLHLSWSRFRFCELLGGTISSLLQSLENTIQLRRSIRAEKTAFEIERAANHEAPLFEVIRMHASELMDQCGSHGMMLKLGDESLEIGSVPPPGQDYTALNESLVDGIATSDYMPAIVPNAEAFGSEIAGVALVQLSDDGRDVLILFREPFEQTIRWAGKPEKIETSLDDGTVRLSPRGSFALWREERRGRSKPYTYIDREVLRIIRRALFALNSLQRERSALAAQRQAETEQARMRLILLDASRNRSMGELSSALAHELIQPLSAVTNYVNACRQELRNYGIAIPPPIIRLIDNAVDESSRAADLVRRMRNFIGQGEIAVEEMDLHAVIRQAVELALVSTADAPPRIDFRLEDALQPIPADPVQLGQVILNLVRNSLSAMEASPTRVLTISTRAALPYLEVSIRDTGRGISKEVEKTLFEPFHSSTTSGMGIGLSLCRSIVEAHGGRISTRPVSDGAEFVFTLRVAGQSDG